MMEGLCFYSSKFRVTKGFKYHAQPQTGAYSCWQKNGRLFCFDLFVCFQAMPKNPNNQFNKPITKYNAAQDSSI